MPKHFKSLETTRTQRRKAHIATRTPLEQRQYTHHEEMLIENFINKVMELRKIQNIRQIYEQLPQIRSYIEQSYLFGELGQLTHRPTRKYIDQKIAKRVQ